MKAITLILAAVFLISPAHAGKKNSRKHAVSERTQARKKAQAEREKAFKAAEAYVESKDLNGDGSLTLHEFTFSEDDKDAATQQFNEANKNKDRYLTKTEVSAMLVGN